MEVGYSNTVVLRHVKQALEDLLAGNVCLTEGVREVVQWGWSNHGLNEELFRPFVGVDSETDRFPVGRVRELWATDALAKADEERIAAEDHYREWVMESANILLAAVSAALPTSTFTDPASN
ncbi:hypothetical protein [Dyella sp. GSA-30]|uniref:hypothetical protein n=1 Tax=Dyella sp. GSA-30 TaxID=2994496 RepID=UPI00248FB114|nr:hypothetical protein [Dyella sp. GSA-30]BDU21706.1 hypothetical protein DYGSA30_31630 [Dyella sp. GSA-30]